MKKLRQREILKILEEKKIGNQRELVRELARRGFHATQATISRDLQELSVVRVPEGDQGVKYARIERSASRGEREELARLVRNFLRGAESSGNLLVLHTDPGDAQPLALGIDRAALPEILGTVAGDDTILCVVKEGVSARKLADYLKRLAR